MLFLRRDSSWEMGYEVSLPTLEVDKRSNKTLFPLYLCLTDRWPLINEQGIDTLLA